MVREIFLVWALASPLAALDQGAPSQPSDQQSPQAPSSNDKDLCSYLKDIEAKTDADCGRDALTALKSQDADAYSQKLELARKRKPEVLKAYEFLKAQPSPEAARRKNTEPGKDSNARRDQETAPGIGRSDQPAATQIQPPINERTFPAWLGAEATGLKEVYSRWLEARSQELKHEKEMPVSPERRKEIGAALAANQAKITALGRITDTAQLSCFLGESCGARRELSGSAGARENTGNGAWTNADYKRANEYEAKRQTRVPGGKIDRGMPSAGNIASEAAANTPLGPLAEKPGGEQQSALKTVATVALATTGALLLFGGLGGKMLEDKFPNIRKNMGIAAVVSGVVAAGAISLSALAPAASSLSSAATTPSTAGLTPALAGGGTIAQTSEGPSLAQAARRTLVIGAGVFGLKTASENTVAPAGPGISQMARTQTSPKAKPQVQARDDALREAEYDRAKNYCNTPPKPGGNECSTLSRQSTTPRSV